MRAVLDPNVIISALLSPAGSPAQVFRSWVDGGYDLVLSKELLAELERALSYPKLRRRIQADEAAELVEWLGRSAQICDRPSGPSSFRSPDPGDDYLIALAATERAVLVSGDRHLLDMDAPIPIFSPAGFLALLDRSEPTGGSAPG